MRLFVVAFSVYNATRTNGVIILREPGADSAIISVCAGHGRKLVRKYICRFVDVMALLTGTPVKLPPMDRTSLTSANAGQASRPSSAWFKLLELQLSVHLGLSTSTSQPSYRGSCRWVRQSRSDCSMPIAGNDEMTNQSHRESGSFGSPPTPPTGSMSCCPGTGRPRNSKALRHRRLDGARQQGQPRVHSQPCR
ncbi:hypothetical protein ACVWZM_002960 [Bradyrhizobium sp. USDA 4501]